MIKVVLTTGSTGNNKKMKYSQKEICRLLNITRETLRFYEKEGIIVPEKDPANGYRMYDDWQMYLISECKRYQTNGFSIGEIRVMLQKDSLDDYISRMAEKQAEYNELAQRYYWMNEMTKDYLARLRSIPDQLGVISRSFLEGISFVPQKKGEELRLDEGSMEKSRKMMTQLQFSFMMAYFPDLSQNVCEWGFGMPRWMKEKTVVLEDDVTEVETADALTCIIDTGSRRNYDASLADDLLAYASQHNLKPAGSFLMRQLVYIHEADNEHRYFEAFLPLAEE